MTPGKSLVHGACCGRYVAGDARLLLTADQDGVESTATTPVLIRKEAEGGS